MRERTIQVWKSCLWVVTGILLVTFISVRPAMAAASEKSEAQALVDKAKASFSDLMNDENFSLLHAYLKSAKAVLIFPQVLKGGFFLGGSGGSGVLLVRDEATGTWSDPAFYTLGSVTFGFQIGGEAAELVMVAVNQKAIDSLLSSSVRLGGDLSVAVGPVGGGAKGALTIPEIRADFVSFARSKGLYAGLNLEGSVMQVRDSLNSSYYGKSVTPKDILIGKEAGAAGANGLRGALEKALIK